MSSIVGTRSTWTAESFTMSPAGMFGPRTTAGGCGEQRDAPDGSNHLHSQSGTRMSVSSERRRGKVSSSKSEMCSGNATIFKGGEGRRTEHTLVKNHSKFAQMVPVTYCERCSTRNRRWLPVPVVGGVPSPKSRLTSVSSDKQVLNAARVLTGNTCCP